MRCSWTPREPDGAARRDGTRRARADRIPRRAHPTLTLASLGTEAVCWLQTGAPAARASLPSNGSPRRRRRRGHEWRTHHRRADGTLRSMQVGNSPGCHRSLRRAVIRSTAATRCGLARRVAEMILAAVAASRVPTTRTTISPLPRLRARSGRPRELPHPDRQTAEPDSAPCCDANPGRSSADIRRDGTSFALPR